MLRFLKEKLQLTTSDEDKVKFDSIFTELLKKHPTGEDAWGLNLDKARKSIELLWPIYKKYFKVRIFGKMKVEDRSYMVVSNHSGQIAIDGMLISTAFATEISPPRMLRSMVERFFTGLPFLGTWAAEGGAVLGDRQNCQTLLERNESVLVFPEGVRGVSKNTEDFYKVQSFTRGFFRLSLQTNTPILPIAVIGAEEFYPLVHQAKGIAKLLGLPALPISLNYIPLPSPVDIRIGDVYEVPEGLSPDAPDKEIDEHIKKIENIIKEMVKEGLLKRRDFWANKITKK